jgi:hypothetical protein
MIYNQHKSTAHILKMTQIQPVIKKLQVVEKKTKSQNT